MSESAAADLPQQVRWRDGVECPRWRSDLTVRNDSYREYQRYLCKNCGRTFNDKTDTISAHSKLSLKDWYFTIYVFLRFNTSIRQIEAELDLSYRTVRRRVERFARSTPVDGVHQLLRDTVEYPFVVILDEADNLHEQDVIEPLHAVPQISAVAICHDPQSWLAQIPMNGSHSFYRDRHIQLRRHGTGELADILEARANQGLAKDLVTRDQLRTIVNHVAGVARFSIQSLYAAAELAVERSHETLRAVDIEDPYDRVLDRIGQSNLNSLPLHRHVLYKLIRVAGEVSASELHERYDIAADQIHIDISETPIVKYLRRAISSKYCVK